MESKLNVKAVVRIGGSEFKTEIENLASSQTCDPFKIPDKHTEDSQQKRSDEPGPSGSKIKQTSHENIERFFITSIFYSHLFNCRVQRNRQQPKRLTMGLIGVGNYRILLNVLEGLHEPARKLIQEYKAKIDALSDGKEKQVNNPTVPALNDTLKHDHSKIHKASMFGHCDEVKELLQNGADANERNNIGESPLHISAKHGHPDVVKELLQNGADTNEWNHKGETPLYISAKHVHLDVVKELLKNGADTNKCNDMGATPLYISAMHGHLDVVKELLQNGADTNKCNDTGATPLYISAMHGHLDVVKELFKNGADTNKCNDTGATPLYISAMHGHLDVVKELFKNGADTNKCNDTGATPLYISVMHGHLDVVKELLKNGADTNKWEYTGETPLYISAKHGHLDVVKELLQNGADTNKCNDTGATPLYISAMHGHLDVVKELFKNGADTNKCNDTGATPLYISAMHGHLDIVKELLQNGADTNKCNDTGATPLYISAMHGHLDVVKELFENGADTNKCYISGDTPLNVAFKHDHHDVVEVLLENKTDRNIKAVDDNYEADVYRKTSNVEKSVLKQKASLKGVFIALLRCVIGITCDQSEIEKIQKIFKKIDISDPVSNRQFVVPPGKLFHIYFIHSSDPSDTLLVETTIKTIQNHGFKCCRGLSKIMNEQSFEKTKTDSCVLCLVLTRCFMEEASRECIELLKSQRCKVLVIQVSENKDTDFQFENLTKIDALDLENVNDIANEKFNCNPSTAFRVRSSIADAEPIDILILTDQIKKPIITKILENRVKITNPKSVSKESDVIISKSEHVKQLTRKQMITAKEIIQANSDQVFKNHRNLNIITSSNLRSKQGGEEIINEPCIVLYCYCKGLIPEEECDFPKTLNWETHQLPVDVREGFFEFGGRYNTGASTKYHEKIKIGCGFGIRATDLEATIGPFLKCYGGVGFLTCAHATCDVHPGNYHYRNPDLNVSAGNYQNEKLNVDSVDCRFHKKQKFYVLQPPPNAFEDCVLNPDVCAVGEVYEAVFKPTCQRKDESSIDASIVKITNQKRIPQRGEFAVHLLSNLKSANFKELPIFEGSVIKDPLKIDTDARIVKFGMASHATRGILNSNGTVVRSNIAGLRSTNQTSFVSTFQNQFEVGSISTCPSTFFQGGDSGSGVFQVEKQGDEDTLHLIGLAIGFTSYKTAIVTPIKDIMEALKIDDDAFKLCQRSGTSTGATSTGATSTGTTLCLNVTPTNNTALLQN
ncbi:hypothetical protein KUTeg_005856 [Tegillarca granosa]|uniref:Uncharacterized protein n=1 Tax=Tegillarca granosa TaxID=220873 RepID=A0ABQ9FH34_TEGGR|nr:hypothetical protein KUTeg_005856 [Tegillarca granosa]